mgnify:CR=1 FL=1
MAPKCLGIVVRWPLCSIAHVHRSSFSYSSSVIGKVPKAAKKGGVVLAELVGFPDREETARQIDRIEALIELETPAQPVEEDAFEEEIAVDTSELNVYPPCRSARRCARRSP